jgi:transcriptional regulator with XRE-family HTH domain
MTNQTGNLYFLCKEAVTMIAEKIKLLREERGWTQAELARRLSITRNGVNSWEQGLSTPSPACLVDLARVFSVSTDYLLGIEATATVNVSGLSEKDVAVLAALADRLRVHRE